MVTRTAHHPRAPKDISVTSAPVSAPTRGATAAASAQADVYDPLASDKRDFYQEVRTHPASAAVALEALTVNESILREVAPALRKDFAFMKRAVLANPFVLLNEGENDWARKEFSKALPAAMRKKLLKDPEVASAVKGVVDELARLPDLAPEMFSMDRLFFREVRRNRLQPNAADLRPLAVVIYPTADDATGQFSLVQSTFVAKHRLMFFRVSSDVEAVHALKEATELRPAQLVVFGGHGSQHLLAFGADDPGRMSPATQARIDTLAQTEKGRAQLAAELERTNEDRYFDFTDADLLRPLADRVAHGAEVVLVSCSTGKGGEPARNLANFIHGIFPHASIVAPTKPVPNNGMIFDDQGAYQRPSFEHGDSAYRVPAGGGPPRRAHQIRRG